MNEHNLEEFEYSRGDLKIRLRKPSANLAPAPPRPAAEIIVPSALAPPDEAGPAGGSDAEVQGGEELHLVKSPIVGTFYASPSPGAEPFVKIGNHVDSGQTLCIIEAMKLMNELEAEMAGEIARIYVESGQPVEYGQSLFAIKPTRGK